MADTTTLATLFPAIRRRIAFDPETVFTAFDRFEALGLTPQISGDWSHAIVIQVVVPKGKEKNLQEIINELGGASIHSCEIQLMRPFGEGRPAEQDGQIATTFLATRFSIGFEPTDVIAARNRFKELGLTPKVKKRDVDWIVVELFVPKEEEGKLDTIIHELNGARLEIAMVDLMCPLPSTAETATQ